MSLSVFEQTYPVQDSLASRWQAFRAQNPQIRIRDAAALLNCSEMALLTTGVTADVVRLNSDWPSQIQAVEGLGQVMALSRNEAAVHEKTGIYQNLQLSPKMGLALGEVIDLRFLFSHWVFGFAVSEHRPGGQRHSLQYFDQSGTAVHKIYLTDESHFEAFLQLTLNHASGNKSGIELGEPAQSAPATTRPETVDLTQLRCDWQAMSDVHQFHGLLKKHGISRHRAFELVGEHLARPVSIDSLYQLFEHVASMQLGVMIFVPNAGMVQIHRGPIHNVVRVGEWLNVLDNDFSLHVRESLLGSAWVVSKPNTHGNVTSLELFDQNKQVVAYCFSNRAPNEPESEHWRALLAGLVLC